MNLKTEIVKEMRRQGMSQYRLAKLSGVSQSMISRILSNKARDLTATTAGKLMDALGLTVQRRDAARNSGSVSGAVGRSR